MGRARKNSGFWRLQSQFRCLRMFCILCGESSDPDRGKAMTEDMEICRCLAKTMEDTKGTFLVQSFNSLVLQWMRKNQKQILRGQLSSDLVKVKRHRIIFFRF